MKITRIDMKCFELTMKKRVLLVELPKEADRIKPFNDVDKPYISYFIGTETHRYYQPFCHLAEIGKLSDLKEDDFATVVENASNRHYKIYRDCTKGQHVAMPMRTESAKASFESAVEAAGYRIGNNRYEDSNGIVVNSEITDWQIEKSKTFHPEQTYIFEILN